MILTKYFHVAFRDKDFDFPVVAFYKDGSVVAATTSIQTKDQIVEIVDQVFGKPSRGHGYQISKIWNHKFGQIKSEKNGTQLKSSIVG